MALFCRPPEVASASMEVNGGNTFSQLSFLNLPLCFSKRLACMLSFSRLLHSLLARGIAGSPAAQQFRGGGEPTLLIHEMGGPSACQRVCMRACIRQLQYAAGSEPTLRWLRTEEKHNNVFVSFSVTACKAHLPEFVAPPQRSPKWNARNATLLRQTITLGETF